MATLEQLRAYFPTAESDSDVIKLASKQFGIDPVEIANEVGFSFNKPGFVSDVKRGTGQVIGAFGSTARDLGLPTAGKAVEGYGEDIAYRNPSQINTVGEAVRSPLTTVREALGEVVPQIGASTAFGMGGRVIGGAIGSLAGPAGTVAGQAIGAGAGAYLGNLIQEYGGIRSEQREQGIEDKSRALATGAAAAGLDTAFGTERVVNKFLSKGSDILARKAGTSLYKQVGKQTAIGLGTEALTETGQTALERYGAHKELTGDEAYNEYGLAAIKGGIGGGVVRGALTSIAGERPVEGGNDIQQAFYQKSETDVLEKLKSTIVQPANHPEPLVRIAELDAISKGTAAFTMEGPDGKPVKVPAQPGRFFTPEEQQEYKALKAQVAAATPPAVVGGTTDIAQQTQAAAAQNQQADQAQQNLAKREEVFGKVATQYNPQNPASLNIFGQNIEGPRVETFGNRFAAVFNTLPPHVQEIAQAITQANNAFATPEKPSPLVSFSFNANNPVTSAEKAVAALGKVMTKFQIDHVQSLDEAVQILNKLSTTTKGNQLEQLNAIYEALTGQDTDGFTAAQTAKAEKGAKDGKLPLQTTTGLGTVPVQGGTGQANATVDGNVQPSGVQPVGTGSLPEGSLGLQVGQPSGEGIRTGTNADTGGISDVGGSNAPSQVTGATNEQALQAGISESGQPSVPTMVEPTVAEGAGPRVYNPQIPYYATDLSHISSTRRVEIRNNLIRSILAPKQEKAGGMTLEQRIEMVVMALSGGDSHADIADRLKVPATTVAKQLQRLGIVIKPRLTEAQQNEVSSIEQRLGIPAGVHNTTKDKFAVSKAITVDLPVEETANLVSRLAELYKSAGRAYGIDTPTEGKPFDELMLDAAEAYRSPEFPDGMGAGEIIYLYSHDRNVTTKETAADQQAKEMGAATAEQLEEAGFGTVATGGGSQGAVGTQATSLLKRVEKLQNDLAKLEVGTPEYADKAEQLAALWTKYAKQQVAIEEAESTTVEEKEEDAVQEPSAEEVPVQKRTGGGKKVGKGNATKSKAAGKTEAKPEPKQEAKPEEIKTPAEEWAVVSTLAPELPPYDVLTNSEKSRWDDLVRRGQANLAAAVKIIGESTQPAGTTVANEKPAATGTDGSPETVSPKFGKDGVATNPYTAAELIKDIKDFIRADILGRKLVIVGSLEDLANSSSVDLQNLAKAIGNKGAYGVAANGTAYLIANRISKGEGRAKFMHEVGAHLGLEKLLPKAVYDQLTAQLEGWVASKDNSLESRIAKKAQARVDAAQTETQDRPAELLAYFVEESMLAGIDPTASEKVSSPLATWFRSLWSAIQTVARKLGLKADKLTAQDVVNMAYGAAKIEMTSDQAKTSAKERTQFGIAGQRSLYNLVAAEANKLKAELVKAKLMYAGGSTEDKMWAETGWFKGVDGKWKYEIPDINAKFKPVKNDKYEIDYDYDLQDVLDHPALFKAYPQLKDYKIIFDADMPPKNASFDPFEGRITMSGQFPDDMPTLLHEIQHAIQQIEGFDPGGSPAHVADPLSINSFLKFEAILRQTGQSKEANSVDKMISFLVRYDDLVNDAQFNLIINADPTKKVGLQMDLDKAVDNYVSTAQRVLQLYKITEEQIRSYLYYGIAGEQEARMVEGRLVLPINKLASTLPKLELNDSATLLVDKTGMAMKFGVNAPSTADQVTSALPGALQKSARARWTNIKSLVNRGLYASAITEDLAGMAKKYMPSVSKYLQAQYNRQATRLSFERRIEDILVAFDKLPQNLQGEGKNSVNAYIYDSTREKKWGYYPGEHQVGTKLFEVDPDFKERFDAFPPAAQKLIKDVFQHGYEALKMKQNAAVAAVEREFVEREKNAGSDADLQQAIAKEKKQMLKRISSLHSVNVGNPYAYLGRYGDYVVTAKSPEFKAYEEAAEGAQGRVNPDYITGDAQQAKNWLQDHINDPTHYVVEFAETQGEADAIAADLIATGQYDLVDSDAHEKEANASYSGGYDLYLGVKGLRTYIEKKEGAKIDPKLDRAIGNLYLMLVAESSARQRKNVAGASKNMMRNLATSGRADAHFLASMEHSDAINESLAAMQREARRGDNRAAMPIYNELYTRHANSLDYEQTGTLSTALTRMTTLWNLSMNPAYYLQQLLQTMVFSLPYMSGRLGYFRSARALKRAYGDMAELVKGLGVNEHINFDKAPEDVRFMLKQLVDMGKIDLGIDAESKARADEQGALGKTMLKLQGINTRIESINRATAAIAAYRAYTDRYKGATGADGVRFAADVVSNTHGSYDAFNTPRVLQGDVARVALQFKRFQIIQLSMLAKLIHTSFKGASAEERAIARASLKYITAHMAVLGGALGVPFVSQAAWILSKVFGDDDEPDDYEYKLRRMIGDDAVADLLLRGVPAAVGLESLGKKLSMENVASPFGPFVEPDLTSRAGAEKMLVGVMGPAANLGLKFTDALGLMTKGNYYKGLELALPNGVANFMKSIRFANEGITMRNGDLVMKPEEISMIDAAFQAVGLPTTTITDRQYTQKVVAEFDKFYAERSKDIKAAYVEGSRASDSAAMAEARDDWQKLQESRVRNGYKRQLPTELFRAPAEARKRERGVVGGVETTKSNRRFVELQTSGS